ncbi:DUF1279 superfamily [Exophiala xenobiotica]|nr:DUF1279 superfamily [Exophiala xenobiotica]
MKSMHFVQRNALRQLLDARPALRQAFINLERQSISQSAFRTRSLQSQKPVTRGLHTQGFSSSTRSSPFAPRLRTRTQAKTLPHSKQGRRCNSTNSTTPAGGEGGGSLSISQRMKKLSREYGWSALGVYLLLTALDFPFCFLAVRMLGTDRIGHWEHVALAWIKGVVSWPLSERTKEVVEGAGDLVEAQVLGDGAKRRILEEESRAEYQSPDRKAMVEVEDHGYKEAEQANAGSNASLWTQLALAYAIHKSFIFIRVPLTAAITPKVVKTLRGWGWNIGKMPKKGVTGGSGSGSSSSSSSSSASGVNTKGSKVKPDD